MLGTRLPRVMVKSSTPVLSIAKPSWEDVSQANEQQTNPHGPFRFLSQGFDTQLPKVAHTASLPAPC